MVTEERERRVIFDSAKKEIAVHWGAVVPGRDKNGKLRAAALGVMHGCVCSIIHEGNSYDHYFTILDESRYSLVTEMKAAVAVDEQAKILCHGTYRVYALDMDDDAAKKRYEDTVKGYELPTDENRNARLINKGIVEKNVGWILASHGLP